MVTEDKELRVQKIKDGTAIDHITAGNALSVLKILGITAHDAYIVSIAMNVPSPKIGKKDVVKVEGRELTRDEADRIALIAPKATINIIRNYNVVEKEKTKLPKVIRDIIKCVNISCISNSDEPVETFFFVDNDSPLRLRCYFCNKTMEEIDIVGQF